ncbi:MAG: type II 3-dehydroquinate dehydratase [Melioribacteraceae bacterium]|jgi:3-dehydroquinate dehydratase-2|nr:type II 3-dehydroquinate dehydratase [Melioribacteraceae bacterium]
MKILVINGPNLNLLKKRNSDHYGVYDLYDIKKNLEDHFPEIAFTFVQSNSESQLITEIQSAPNLFNALIINPGGFSHTGIALRDALEICNIPKIEVHLSNITSRENFRKNSLTASVCDGYISGLKHYSYIAAAYVLSKID